MGLTYTKGHINSFIDQVDTAIHKEQIKLNIRVGFEEGLYERGEKPIG